MRANDAKKTDRTATSFGQKFTPAPVSSRLACFFDTIFLISYLLKKWMNLLEAVGVWSNYKQTCDLFQNLARITRTSKYKCKRPRGIQFFWDRFWEQKSECQFSKRQCQKSKAWRNSIFWDRDFESKKWMSVFEKRQCQKVNVVSFRRDSVKNLRPGGIQFFWDRFCFKSKKVNVVSFRKETVSKI